MQSKPTYHLSRRPGTALILACALLTLLALLGVTYLSATQTERYASNQNSVNTQADLLLQGLVTMTASSIPQSLYGVDSQGRRLRPACSETSGESQDPLSAYCKYLE